jgi:SAM-dependent methyltransferase
VTDHAQRIVNLYEENAAAWDRLRNRDPEQRLLQPENLFEKPWLDRFLGLLPPRGSILDLGCASGVPISAYLIHRGFAVTGVDSSPSMIALCRERFPQSEWLVADMRTLALDRRFDGILAWDSFFHLNHDDQRAMFPVFASHAQPRGTLMFTSGPQHGEVLGEFAGEPLYHSSLDPTEYRTLLHQNGFQVVGHVLHDPACGEHTVWLARAR